MSLMSRTECEKRIEQAQAAYREAEAAGDQLGQDFEEEVINELLELYATLPVQRTPHHGS
jgi:hypothetical protein